MKEQTHYEILEVEPGAPLEAIRAAWERLRRLLGPGSLAVYSLVEPAEADAQLRRIDEAWAVLSDPDSRRRYDASLGLAPAVEEEPRAAPSFAEAVARIGAAGRGREVPAPEAAELVVDDADLLEVVEVDAIRVARPNPGFAAQTFPAGEAILDADDIGAEPVEEAPAADGAQIAAASLVKPAEARAAGAPEGDAGATAAAPPTTLNETTEYTGALLRRLRLERGIDLEQIAASTRIGASHLANIEAERWEALPERVYLRGYLEAYARELRLDAARVCATYLARLPAARRR